MQILNYYANESRHQISILAPRAIFWLLLNYILYIIFYICILGLMRTFKICFKYNFPSFLLFYISVIKSYLQSSHLFVAVLSLVILYQILYFHCFWIMLGAQWDLDKMRKIRQKLSSGFFLLWNRYTFFYNNIKNNSHSIKFCEIDYDVILKSFMIWKSNQHLYILGYLIKHSLYFMYRAEILIIRKNLHLNFPVMASSFYLQSCFTVYYFSSFAKFLTFLLE